VQEGYLKLNIRSMEIFMQLKR